MRHCVEAKLLQHLEFSSPATDTYIQPTSFSADPWQGKSCLINRAHDFLSSSIIIPGYVSLSGEIQLQVGESASVSVNVNNLGFQLQTMLSSLPGLSGATVSRRSDESNEFEDFYLVDFGFVGAPFFEVNATDVRLMYPSCALTAPLASSEMHDMYLSRQLHNVTAPCRLPCIKDGLQYSTCSVQASGNSICPTQGSSNYSQECSGWGVYVPYFDTYAYHSSINWAPWWIESRWEGSWSGINDILSNLSYLPTPDVRVFSQDGYTAGLSDVVSVVFGDETTVGTVSGPLDASTPVFIN
jgi:hypothetical protein